MTPDRFTMGIEISMSVFQDLWGYKEQTGSKEELRTMADAAINEWLLRQNRRERGKTDRKLVGYQWKQVFLPDGTFLRTVFKGQSRRARVTGSKIIFEQKVLSPSEFANAAGGVGRNAWKTVWLLFPGQSNWQLADEFRPQSKRRPC